MKQRIYLSIDLKSFYASVECIERGLDPMTTNLVVADNSRTEKTICLAVSPSLKSFGIPGRPRLFEVVQKVRDSNYKRRAHNRYQPFTSKSYNINVLKSYPETEIDYIVAIGAAVLVFALGFMKKISRGAGLVMFLSFVA